MFKELKVRRRITSIALITVLLCALLCSCEGLQTETSSEPSFAASESSGTFTEDTSDIVERPLYRAFTLSAEDLPANSDLLRTVQILDAENSTLSQFCNSYTGSFPAIADILCTQSGVYVCAVYQVSRSEEDSSYSVQYGWIPVDQTQQTFGALQADAPASYVYDKNKYCQSSYFWIDYGSVGSGIACPYVLLYHTEGEDRPLLVEESSSSYARIIRQCDEYAVLSIRTGDERSYRLVDSTGKILSELEWISDISAVSPLMFHEKLLYCKSDTDEDYVYDTIGVFDLESGEYRDLLSVGNCSNWTYFADGSMIAFCEENGEVTDQFRCFFAEDESLHTVTLQGAVEMLEAATGVFYGVTGSDDGRRAFVWSSETSSLFETDAHSAQSRFSFGERIFAVLDAGTVSVYVPESDAQ